MAMIRFVLRHQDDIWLWNFRKVLNPGGACMLGKEEFAMDHGTGTCQPWVNEDRERSWHLLILIGK